MSRLSAVILAAGKSTRMKSRRTKVMHPIAGRPVISYVIDAAAKAGARDPCVVTSRDQRELNDYLTARGIDSAHQREPLGTAHAVMAARRKLGTSEGYVLILCGDIPLVDAAVLKVFTRHVTERDAKVGVLTMCMSDGGKYGRIVRDLDGRIVRIVEAKDAAEHELAIKEVNTGIFCVAAKWLFRTLPAIEPRNAQGEYYLTDIVACAIAQGTEVTSQTVEESMDFVGINTREELGCAAERMRERINRAHQADGVGILDFRHTYIDADAAVGMDTEVWPQSFLLGSTRVGADCIVENGVVLKNAVIGDGVHIKSYTVIEDSTVAAGAVIGPFARVRPGSNIGKRAQLGNFVEVKKSAIGEGAKANHLSYLGDAVIGAGTNIGCGTITCNYDGRAKHRTVIGPGAFIGSDTQFIAPVRIGRNATIGAGSTITKDVPAEALALSRTEQIVVRNWRKKK